MIVNRDSRALRLTVNLEPGIYRLDNESATGKTRMFNFIRSKMTYMSDFGSFTYQDYLAGLDITKFIKLGKHKVAFFDRYDMYAGEYTNFIKEFSKNGIVLLDLKRTFQTDMNIKFAYTKLGENYVEVGR